MPKKNAIAQAMVALRNKKLSPARRKEIAEKAAAARWADKPKKVKKEKLNANGGQ